MIMRQSDGIIAPMFKVFVVTIPTLKFFHFCNDVQWVHIISELFYILEIKVFVAFRPTLKYHYIIQE